VHHLPPSQQNSVAHRAYTTSDSSYPQPAEEEALALRFSRARLLDELVNLPRGEGVGTLPF